MTVRERLPPPSTSTSLPTLLTNFNSRSEELAAYKRRDSACTEAPQDQGLDVCVPSGQDRDFHKRVYHQWLESESSRNTSTIVFELSRELLYIGLLLYLFANSERQYTLADVVVRFLVAIVWQPFTFMIVHSSIHMNMLSAYQKDGKEKIFTRSCVCSTPLSIKTYSVGLSVKFSQIANLFSLGLVAHPYAYFHHYVDPRLYAILPHGYRNDIHGGTDTALALPFTLLVGLDPVFYLIHTLVILLDLVVHEWYHTSDRLYVSWNPFSSKFRPLLWFMLFLQRIGWADKEVHKIEHHAERAERKTRLGGLQTIYVFRPVYTSSIGVVEDERSRLPSESWRTIKLGFSPTRLPLFPSPFSSPPSPSPPPPPPPPLPPSGMRKRTS